MENLENLEKEKAMVRSAPDGSDKKKIGKKENIADCLAVSFVLVC